MAFSLLGCGGGSTPPDSLPNRSGGAFITLGNPDGTGSGPDEITLWITDSAFIDEAIQRQANGTWRVAYFGQVLTGADVDAEHAWHVAPAQAEWVDATIEECDATMTYISQNRDAWLARPRPDWCPWGGKVLRVVDRR